MNIKNWASRLFGRYISAEASTRRRDPGTRVQSSDDLLSEAKRNRLTEGGRELWRNYSVAAWAIRKHLDYVSSFNFQALTEDEQLNEQLENLVAWWSRPLHFDVAARHSMRRMLRILETRRVIDGDVFLVKLRDGRLQPIEGDRVRNPDQLPGQQDQARWTHGIKVGAGGRMNAVAVHRRDPGWRYELERIVPARNVLHLGYFDQFEQVRGVSPLSSAIDQFQDVLEVTDYARAKAKITQLFALAITRQMGDLDEEDDDNDSTYDIDIGKGPVKVEMDPGDELNFLESKHPSTEFQDYLKLTLMAAMKALDIPWSFYDESFTNFFGSRAALIQYQQSCRSKREDLQELLSRLTIWRMGMWLSSGALVLPAGVRLSDIKFDWVPSGLPWWDPAKEVKGDILSIGATLRTRSEIRRERYGDDWRKVVKQLKREEDLLEANGIVPGRINPVDTTITGQGPGENEEDDD